MLAREMRRQAPRRMKSSSCTFDVRHLRVRRPASRLPLSADSRRRGSPALTPTARAHPSPLPAPSHHSSSSRRSTNIRPARIRRITRVSTSYHHPIYALCMEVGRGRLGFGVTLRKGVGARYCRGGTIYPNQGVCVARPECAMLIYTTPSDSLPSA
ncbi:hypothetical protein C8R46DRAFT_1120069 [Mycena filopes]|nr:hypothetical protein C8R46DRAFT_1120069 [Mycena filopes]